MTNPAYAAFQGGGALGMAHLGAWQVVAQRFHFSGVAGTSAGAIVAALCAAGHDPAHVIDLFNTLDWPAFVNRQGIIALAWKRNAWSDGENFYQWLLSRMAQRFPGVPPYQMTFARLNQETGIYLAVFACNLNDPTATPLVFDKETEPNTTVAFAVRASISIPGIFATVPRRDRGEELVDGGLLLNFPVEHLQSRAQQTGCPLIGVRFDRPLAHLDSPKIGAILGRSYNLALTRGSQPTPQVMQDPNYIDIVIDVSDFEAFNFDLTQQQKQELLRRGAAAAKLALDQFDLRVARAELAKANTQRQTAPSQSQSEASAAATSQPVAVPAPSQLTLAPPPSSTRNSRTNSGESAEQLTPREGGGMSTLRHLANLSQQQIRTLTDRLLDCPSIRGRSSREAVLNQLPPRILDSIDRSAQGRTDMLNVVTTCLNTPGGIESLIEAVRFFDDRTYQMQQLDDFMKTLQ